MLYQTPCSTASHLELYYLHVSYNVDFLVITVISYLIGVFLYKAAYCISICLFFVFKAGLAIHKVRVASFYCRADYSNTFWLHNQVANNRLHQLDSFSCDI